MRSQLAKDVQRAIRFGSIGSAWARRAGWGMAIVLAFGNAALCRCQSQPGSSNPLQGSTDRGIGRQTSNLANNDSEPDFDSVMAERRIRALNMERQKRMVADANKLLNLAKELNDEVAAANSGSLTSSQLHKIGEIEKLARSVKERMTAGVVDAPSIPPPMAPNLPSRQIPTPQ